MREELLEPSAAHAGATEVAREVAVVVVSHNNEGEIARCLDGLSRLDGTAVHLVDSGSRDDTAAVARRLHPGVEVHALEANEGFGAAANRGVGRVDAEYVLVLNADAWPEAGAVDLLLEHARARPSVAMVAPSLLNVDGSFQRSVFAYPRNAVSLAAWVAFPKTVSRVYQLVRPMFLAGRAAEGEMRLVDEPEYPAGAAILVRRDVFEELGGFDERFFMYSEETDLCCRMRAAGWDIAYVPEARFRHVGGASTASAPEQMYAYQLLSHLYLLAKRRGRGAAERARRLVLVVLALRALVSRPARSARLRGAARLLRSTEARSTLASFR